MLVLGARILYSVSRHSLGLGRGVSTRGQIGETSVRSQG